MISCGWHPNRQHRYYSISSWQLPPPINVRHHILLRFHQPERLYQSRKLPSPILYYRCENFYPLFCYPCFSVANRKISVLFTVLYCSLANSQRMDMEFCCPGHLDFLSLCPEYCTLASVWANVAEPFGPDGLGQSRVWHFVNLSWFIWPALCGTVIKITSTTSLTTLSIPNTSDQHTCM